MEQVKMEIKTSKKVANSWRERDLYPFTHDGVIEVSEGGKDGSEVIFRWNNSMKNACDLVTTITREMTDFPGEIFGWWFRSDYDVEMSREEILEDENGDESQFNNDYGIEEYAIIENRLFRRFSRTPVDPATDFREVDLSTLL